MGSSALLAFPIPGEHEKNTRVAQGDSQELSTCEEQKQLNPR